MASSGRTDFRLVIPGISKLAGLVHQFLEQALSASGYEGDELVQLVDATCSVLNIVEGRLEADDDVALPIELTLGIDQRMLAISIIEHGVPLGDRDHLLEGSGQTQLHETFDHVHWVQLGAGGSEIRLERLRTHTRISTLVDRKEEAGSAATRSVPAESSGTGSVDYHFRTFRSGDELEIARQFYQSYGRTYPNPDLLYPERILAMNEQGLLHSIVAETGDGTIAGHYGIERPDLGVIGEAGLAVIDPAHRKHGLLTRMRSFLVDEARRLELLGLWSQPTAQHAYSQKMNIQFGSTLNGLSLGTTPAEVEWRGASGDNDSSRHSCFLYWYPLNDEESIRCSVPESLMGVLGPLYEARGRAHRFDGAINQPVGSTETGTCNLHGAFNRTRRSGHIRVDRIDALTLPLVRQLVTNLVAFSHAEVVYLDLPITDESCAWLTEALHAEGFILCGIGPRFLSGEDALRLQRLLVDVDPESLVVEGDLASGLAEHVFAEIRAIPDSRVP